MDARVRSEVVCDSFFLLPSYLGGCYGLWLEGHLGIGWYGFGGKSIQWLENIKISDTVRGNDNGGQYIMGRYEAFPALKRRFVSCMFDLTDW